MLGEGEEEETQGAVVNKKYSCTPRNALFSVLSGWVLWMVATKRTSEVCVSKYVGSEKQTY